MTDVVRQNTDSDLLPATPDDVVTDWDEPFCLDGTEPEWVTYPTPEKKNGLARRVAGKTTKYLAVTALSASTIFVAQNPREVTTMVPGLFAGGDMHVPQTEGCEPYEPAPPPDIVLPDGTPPSLDDTPTPTTEPEPVDKEDERANGASSAATNNSWQALLPHNLWETWNEYDGYFDNYVTSHTSELSGIEYQFYTVGEGDAPQFNFDSLEEIEHAAFHEDITYYTPEKAHAIECMREALFGEDGEPGRFEGRVMPIVVPTTPACVKDFRIRYDDYCAQMGYKMPRADIDFLFWDLNPDFDEFMVLTTGETFDRDLPIIDAEETSHEIWHMQQEWAEGSGYRFELTPEERMAKAISRRVEASGVLDCAMPLVFYGTEEQVAEYAEEMAECADEADE